MKRSKNQAVYKFLPGMWVSEKNDSGRSITAEIKNWNNKRMENIYGSFIEGEIKRQIRLFENRGGNVNSFNLDGESSFLIVEPACNKGIPDIIGEISPLLFYCSSCHHSLQVMNSSKVNTGTWKCPNCEKWSIKQLQMVYACECGYAQPIKRPIVKGITEFLYKPNQNQYKMYYKQGRAEKAAEFAIMCPNCQARLVPDNAESSRNYKPFTLRIINLVDKKSGDFFEKGQEAQKIVIAKWFGILTYEEFNEILDNVELAFSDRMRNNEQLKEVEKAVQAMVDAGFVSPADYQGAVNKMLEMKKQNGGVEKHAADCDELFVNMKKLNETDYSLWVSNYSYKLMQYDTIKYAKQVIKLQDVIDKQLSLEFISSPTEIIEMNQKFGIANMQISCGVEIINCTYGYTRKVSDPVNNRNLKCRLKLNAFDKVPNSNSNLVYGSKLETEGILFEISQRKIVEWLRINNIISEEQMPDLDDEISVKKWFAENVKGDVVSAFGEIKESEKITINVFALLHSMSHAFLMTAGEISGLEVNSLTEIISVETTSIFIYAQTSQAIPLGSLSGMAENNYAQFLKKVFLENRNCVFDPICTDREDTSCIACMIIPEISCNHFNNELGRKYLYSVETMDNHMIGFWEM